MLKTADSSSNNRFRASCRRAGVAAGRDSSATRSIFSVLAALSLAVAAPEAGAMVFKIAVGAVSKKSKDVYADVISSKDGKILSTTPVAVRRSLSLDFPEEGHYILQMRADGKVVLRENIFILVEKPTSDLLVKASWAPKKGTMRSVIRVQDTDGGLRFGVSIRDKIFLRLRQVPRLVRVVQEDYSGTATAAQDLRIVKVTEKQAIDENNDQAIEIQAEPQGSDDDQAVYEPDYKGLLAGKEDKSLKQKIMDLGGARSLQPLNRRSRLYGWLRIMQETFTVRRGADTYNGEKTQGFGTGWGGDFIFKDTMSLQLEVDTHGSKTQYQKGGLNPPSEEQKRIHLRFGPLLDLLNVEHGHPRYALEIGPVIGYTQMPLEKDDQGKTDFGGSLRAQYFGLSTTALQFRFMKSHSRDLSLTWIGSSYKMATLSPLFGLYNYHSEFDSGDSRGGFDETGVRFGISREF